MQENHKVCEENPPKLDRIILIFSFYYNFNNYIMRTKKIFQPK